MIRSEKEIRESIDFYEKNYMMSPIIITGGSKVFIGNRFPRKCRFCGKMEPEVSFKEKAHALPEFTGNKNIFSYEECDSCNHKFSEEIEDNLAKYLKAYHSFGQVRGKKGVPTVKNNVRGGEFRVGLGEESLEIMVPQNNDVVNLKEHTVEFTVETEPVILLSAFKCLVKMGLSLLEEKDLKLFSEAVLWLQKDISASKQCPDNFFRVMRTFTPGPLPYRGVHSCFFKRKNDDSPVPYMTFLTCFGNNTFQIVLPCPKMDCRKESLTLIPSVTPYELDKLKFGDAVNFFWEDWSSITKKTYTQKFYMHYDKLITT